MLKNYFRIAWRNIKNHKTYTIINVLGLALGICAAIVIFLVTNFEFSFDTFHPDKERIYRIVGESKGNSGETAFLNNVNSDVAGFQTQIPGFEAKAAFHEYGGSISIADGKNPPKKMDNKIAGSYSPTAIITWPEYFDIFAYQWLAGKAQTLNEPFKVVLTENRARKYFGNIPLNDIIGKTVTYDDSLAVTVSGILKDWSGNTDLGYTDFISISTATHSFLKSRIPTGDWSSLRLHNGSAYVKLAKGTTPAQINDRFAAFVKDNVKLSPGTGLRMYLQPLSQLHFTSDYHRGDDGDDFRKAYMPVLYTLMGVALFILIIAAVNFINLSTAQSIQRAKEIGVRKVLGGSKNNIISQFLTETFVLTLFAVLLSVAMMRPMLHLFSDYVPEGVVFHLFDSSTLIFLGVVTVLTTLLAGSYPAKVLASYLPALSLKGPASYKWSGKAGLRRALIVFQFTISLVFIIGAIVIGKQMNFMKNADKGFNADAVITVAKWGDRSGKLKTLAETIRQIPGVDKVVWQGVAPMGFASMSSTYIYKGKRDIQLQPMLEMGDEGYIPFYRMKLVAGRNLAHSDSVMEFVVNEALVKAIGFDNPRDAIGKMLYDPSFATPKAFPIVGVIADFQQGSYHDAIRPAIIENDNRTKMSIAIRLAGSGKNTGDVKAILSRIGVEWKKFYPESPFDYSFLNESISWLYGQDEKTAWLANVAMGITIFISCMGLFGLGMFTAQKRTKEIGIRKVLGASVANITSMLSKDFAVLVIIAMVIASPIAWYFTNRWLADFAYRTPLSWWVFLVAGVGALAVALLTVSFQSIRAAVANPVKSLRTE